MSMSPINVLGPSGSAELLAAGGSGRGRGAATTAGEVQLEIDGRDNYASQENEDEQEEVERL